jgi:hypothetical protein
VSYRNVRVLPPLDPGRLEAAAAAAAEQCAAEAEAAAAAAGSPEARKGAAAGAAGSGAAGAGAATAAAGPPSCFDLAARAVARALSPRYACRALQVAELLLPMAEGVYADAVGYIGRRFEQVGRGRDPEPVALEGGKIRIGQRRPQVQRWK